MSGVDIRNVVTLPGFSSPIDVPYLAGNFAATAAMTWTVDLADQITFAYAKSGKLMWVECRIINTTIGGVVAGANLTIAIPEGRTGRRDIDIPALAAPGGGATEGCFCAVRAGSNVLTIARYAANWVLGANNTTVNISVLFDTN